MTTIARPALALRAARGDGPGSGSSTGVDAQQRRSCSVQVWTGVLGMSIS